MTSIARGGSAAHLIPGFVRTSLSRCFIRVRYDVRLCTGVRVSRRCVFEGSNVVGEDSWVHDSHFGFASYVAENSRITTAHIGRFCSIGANVTLSLGRHPTSECVSTHPALFSTKGQAGFTLADRDLFDEHTYVDEARRYTVHVGNDVWIGNNVLIADGITIADGAVIGAGSIVTKDIGPYAIAVGVPAAVIRHRFDSSTIAALLEARWWDWDRAKLERLQPHFMDVEAFLRAASEDR